MGAYTSPRIGNISHDGLLAASAEDSFQSFKQQLQNVVAFPRRIFD